MTPQPLLPHWQDDTVQLFHGDCIEVLRQLPDNSVDSVVTDPPYGLGFMGKAWDDLPPGLPWAQECLRVLKPGGHLLAFGGTRTWHRLACAVEDAGFEVRDSLAWLYGSGFPKSLDVARAIDAHQKHGGSSSVQKRKAAMGDSYVESDVKGQFRTGHSNSMNTPRSLAPEQQGARTPDAEQWQGWGTALKPAFEPVVVARKPLQGTVAANVLAHGTGALNIDGCRVEGVVPQVTQGVGDTPSSYSGPRTEPRLSRPHAAGRWPANVLLDGSQADALDEQSGVLHSQATNNSARSQVKGATDFGSDKTERVFYGKEEGGASRFFPTFRYQAKAPTRERPRGDDGTAHPTVKPLELMRWLVRLVTPPGGLVLEPFAGSGTTAQACQVEGFHCIAIEREATYLPLIVQRLTTPPEPEGKPAPRMAAPPTLRRPAAEQPDLFGDPA